MSRKTLLLNWVYYPPVGHAVEALKVAKGLSLANKDAEIHLLLNSRTATELADACDWIAGVYPIDLDEVTQRGDAARCLCDLPQTWDYVVTDHRPKTTPFHFSPPLRTFHDLAETRFKARFWKGHQHELQTNDAPGYQYNATIRLKVPEHAKAYVHSLAPSGNPRICMLPAGSSDEPIYPSAQWWKKAVRSLQDTFPHAHFFITGKSNSTDGRSATLSYTQSDLASWRDTSESVINCYDIGLWNQLALLEVCDILVAPHTGFAFLAPSVGTPWLAISGVRWPECFFNGVPFYSVLPDCVHYPCWEDMKPECGRRLRSNEPVLCMDAQLEGRLPDLIHGARLLLEKDFSFESAMSVYQQRIDRMGSARQRFFSIV